MNIIGVIPARGGSKGISKKNLQKINGKSLLQYAIESGENSRYINKLIVSSEDDMILEESKKLNCEIHQRPKELAGDDTPTFDVICNLLDYLIERQVKPDLVVLLQPTAPLRSCLDIDSAIEIMFKENCDSIVSVAEVPSHFNPDWQLQLNKFNYLSMVNNDSFSNLKYQRQKIISTYFRNGAIYITKLDTIKEYKNLYGENCAPYFMPYDRSINIDTIFDLQLAKYLMKNEV